MIYFLQDSERFGIKIGYAKNDVEARAATLQTGNQIPLVILAAMPGERKDEAELHQRFASHRIMGEWFQPCPDLLRVIASVVSGGRVIRREPPFSVYLAGKITGVGGTTSWRRQLWPDGVPPISFDPEEEMTWPTARGVIRGGHHYTGPYPAPRETSAHGVTFRSGEEDWHGQFSASDCDRLEEMGALAHERATDRGIIRLCLDAIRGSDLVFAWIDSLDCYGTVAEVGYAVGRGVPAYVASPRPFRDMWFVSAMSSIGVRWWQWPDPRVAFDAAVRHHAEGRADTAAV